MTEILPGVPPLPIERPAPTQLPTGLAERGPLSRLRFTDGTIGWLVTSHALTRAVLADPRFSSRGELRKSPIPGVPNDPSPVKPGLFLVQDAPEHTHYRRLLTGQFTVRRMNELVPRIQQITDEHIESMRRHGPPVDLVQEFALPIPSLVICELLGVPYEDRAVFQENSNRLLDLTLSPEEGNAAVDAIEEFLLQLVVAKRARPDDTLISGLASGGTLTDQEISTMSMLLLVAGHETTANMLALGTFTLLTRPDELAGLRSDPSLVDGAVEELLRYLTVVHFGTVRVALEDVELGGELIRRGDQVSISLAAANRDPMRFVDPDRLKLNGTAAGHVAFGHGIHQCLGQQLARLEMRIGFSTLLRSFPALRLAAEPSEIRMRDEMAIYGVHELPVAW